MRTSDLPPVLVVEDSDDDFVALSRAMRKTTLTNPLHRCVDGDDCLDYLLFGGKYQDPSSAPCPILILLDLNLPGTDGRDVLTQVKQHPTLKSIPVAVITTSSDPKDIDVCYKNGVNSYLLKHSDYTQFQQAIQLLVQYWFEAVVLPRAH